MWTSKIRFLPTVDWCEIRMVSADIFHSFLACFPWWSCIHEKPTLLMLIFSRWMLSCQKGRRVQKSLMFTSIHLALNKKPRSALSTFLPLSYLGFFTCESQRSSFRNSHLWKKLVGRLSVHDRETQIYFRIFNFDVLNRKLIFGRLWDQNSTQSMISAHCALIQYAIVKYSD